MDSHNDFPHEVEGNQLNYLKGDQSSLSEPAISKSKLMMPQEYGDGLVQDVAEGKKEMPGVDADSQLSMPEKPSIDMTEELNEVGSLIPTSDVLLSQSEKPTGEGYTAQPLPMPEQLNMEPVDDLGRPDSGIDHLDEPVPSIGVPNYTSNNIPDPKPLPQSVVPPDLPNTQASLVTQVEHDSHVQSSKPEQSHSGATVQSEQERSAQEALRTSQYGDVDASAELNDSFEPEQKTPPGPKLVQDLGPPVESEARPDKNIVHESPDSRLEVKHKSTTASSDGPTTSLQEAEVAPKGNIGQLPPSDGKALTRNGAGELKEAVKDTVKSPYQRGSVPDPAALHGEKEGPLSKLTHGLTLRVNHVLDLIHWRDLKKSGVVFGAGFLVLLSLVYFSVISVFAYVLLTTVAVSAIIRVVGFARHTLQHGPEGHPLKEYIEQDLSLPEEKVQDAAQLTVKKVNCYINCLRDLLLVQSYINSLKFALLLWIITYIGKWFNGLTLIILCYVGLFTLPKVYEMNKVLIDGYVDTVSSRVSELKAKIVSAIPMGHKQAVASSEEDKKSH